MKLYYYINDDIFKINSLKKNYFKSEFLLYKDKNLTEKAGIIVFNSVNIQNPNDFEKIKQSCNVNIVLNNGHNIMYNYVRNGLEKIKTETTYSNSNVKKIKRVYITRNLRKLCLV